MLVGIRERLKDIRTNLPEGVELIAVSKTKPIEDIKAAYSAGQKVFGENRVEELVVKFPALPADIEWHMIGNLQSKKVKKIAPFIALIHSVGSQKLLQVINSEAAKNDRIIKVLLQFHIAKEETKSGLSMNEADEILGGQALKEYKHVKVVGVMGMATYTDDMDQVRSEFRALRSIFDQLKSSFFAKNPDFREISMGMSGDYKIAIEEGSTMVRVGSSIFGSRL